NIDEESELNTISQLTLSHKIVFDSTYFNYYLIQDASSGDSYFGGHYNTSEDKYYFRITQHLQDLIEGSTADSKLRLEMVGGAVHANRLIAGGYDPINLEDKKMKLQIIYTKIDSD
ncbi:MAG: DUF4270 family protein, partial [Bacteroidales bacterium]|nr:DUF4270 family protein [Bacteroidales bacterium]